jgi:hypothetical protein
MNKKYLIYGGIGVVVLIAVYFATKSPDAPTTDEGSTEGDTPSNDGITKEQKAMDEKLVNTIKFAKPKNKTDVIKSFYGKNVYTKVDNVKLRKEPYVNNGTLNNIFGTIAKKDVLIGTIGSSYLDREDTINPSTNQVYNWFQIKLSDAVYNDINKNQKNFLTKQFSNVAMPYVREDVIRL